MARLTTFILLMFELPASGLPGQRFSLPPGTRVRVWVAGEPSVGSVKGLGGDTLGVALDRGGPWLVRPMRAIGRVEVSRGVKSQTSTGLGVGLLAGLLVGGVIGHAADPEYGGGAGLLLGAPAGMLLGAAVGSHVHVEQWAVAYDSTPIARTGSPAFDKGVSESRSFGSLRPGQRVRIQAREGGHWITTTGAVRDVRGDTLVINEDFGDSAWVVPGSRIGRIGVSAGKRGHPVRMAAIGYLVGLLVDPEQSFASSMIGPAVGGLVGFLGKTERWEEMGRPARLGLSLVPNPRGGVTVSATLTF